MATVATSAIMDLPVNDIIASTEFNVRKVMEGKDEDSTAGTINKLAAEIKQHGLLSPLTVRRTPKGYELVAGFRRLEAIKKLGLDTVRAQVQDYDDETAYVVNLVENLARKDLSTYEIATRCMEMSRKFKWSGAEIGAKLGLGKAYVNNLISARMSLHKTILEAWENGNEACTTGNLNQMKVLEKAEQLEHWHSLIGTKPEAEGGGEASGKTDEAKPRARRYQDILEAIKSIKKGRKELIAEDKGMELALNLTLRALEWAAGKHKDIPGLYSPPEKVKRGKRGKKSEDAEQVEESSAN